ncbi:hypothetical protein MPSEU_000789800 [Mayamaea pseudoterrestris]|nr:hypothetical protein MPSEU_000789800 [Mayamaea pseudoterrestris]
MLLLSLLLSLVAASNAFCLLPGPITTTTTTSRHVAAAPLRSTASSDASPPESSSAAVPLIVSGRNVQVTDALMEHVQKRIGNVVNKLSGNNMVKECDVILSVSKNPKYEDSHRVEVVTNLKGTTIVSKAESSDMYSSIDAVSHALNRKLLKYKQRRTAGWHGGASMSDDLLQAFEELEQMETEAPPEPEEFEDFDKKEVVKINSFDLKHPISVDEAVFALDYVDHDFYIFLNEATNKIAVVYKRHVGGIGLIEP